MWKSCIYLFIAYFIVDWYILSNGVDTVDCGPSKSTACKTLDWILTRFHNTSAHSGAQTLSLITDTNLTVDQSTVRFIWVFLSVHLGLGRFFLKGSIEQMIRCRQGNNI